MSITATVFPVKKERSLFVLDIGATIGWAEWNGDSLFAGSHTFKGPRVERAVALREWLGHTGGFREADIVGYERPFSRGLAATRSLWGQAGIIESMAKGAVLDVTSISVKKWLGVALATKKGEKASAAQKAGVLESLRLLGYDPKDEHSADAIALLLYIREHACNG